MILYIEFIKIKAINQLYTEVTPKVIHRYKLLFFFLSFLSFLFIQFSLHYFYKGTMSQFDRYKLHPRMMHILVPLFLSCGMSCIVSFVSTLLSVGWSGFAFGEWLGAWMISWLVAFPSVLILLPIMRRLALMLVRKPE